jgi:hypothetical protein
MGAPVGWRLAQFGNNRRSPHRRAFGVRTMALILRNQVTLTLNISQALTSKGLLPVSGTTCRRKRLRPLPLACLLSLN